MGAQKHARAAVAAVPVPAASAPAGGGPPQQRDEPRSCLTNQLRKTRICAYHLKGTCRYGNACAFAHSCTELQSIPDLRKTRLCEAYEQGWCTNKDCSFAHGEEDLRTTNLFYKKTLCIWNAKGKCRSGDQCRFAHGTAELRSYRGGHQGDGNAPSQQPPSKQAAAPGGKGDGLAKQPMKVLPAAHLAPAQVAVPAELGQPLEIGTPPEAVKELGRPFPMFPAAYAADGLNVTPPGEQQAAAWWQWPLHQGVAPPIAVPGVADEMNVEDLQAELHRLCRAIAKKDLELEVERLRQDAANMAMKYNALKMQIQATSDPTFPGAYLKTPPGLDVYQTGAECALGGC